MGKPYLLHIFESNYCKIVFLISIVIVYFLTPQKIFYGFYYSTLGILFIIVTALTITCLVRSVKEKIISIKSSGASIIGIISIIFGYGAIQACAVGAPVCGTTIVGGILALIFPNVVFGLFEKYGLYVLISSIVIQVLALYSMSCFKMNKNIKEYNFSFKIKYNA